jgi:hypothetical protein
MDRVIVDLSETFAKGTRDRGWSFVFLTTTEGQAYVALSRATTFEGLQVRGFTSEKYGNGLKPYE